MIGFCSGSDQAAVAVNVLLSAPSMNSVYVVDRSLLSYTTLHVRYPPTRYVHVQKALVVTLRRTQRHVSLILRQRPQEHVNWSWLLRNGKDNTVSLIAYAVGEEGGGEGGGRGGGGEDEEGGGEDEDGGGEGGGGGAEGSCTNT